MADENNVVVSVNGVVGNNGGGGGGMDCMPLRPGPFHYLISEQAKSLVALQELQNEVGALLEFRDLVIETFPNLRHKMAVTATNNANSSGCASSTSPNGSSSNERVNASSGLISTSQGSHIPLPLSSQRWVPSIYLFFQNSSGWVCYTVKIILNSSNQLKFGIKKFLISAEHDFIVKILREPAGFSKSSQNKVVLCIIFGIT